MADPGKIPAISSQAGDLQEWLTAYLHTRAQLASSGSDFSCDPACTRPGCKHQDLQVQVSLVDLLGAARNRGASVWAIFQGSYSLGLFADERDDWLRRVALKLKKPCPFLENDLCSIYPVRPLPCVLFPEDLVGEGTFAANAQKDHFRDYLCFKRPLVLSPERARIMAQLKKMWRRETSLTSFYLFQHSPCLIDLESLTPELLHAAGLKAGESGERLEPGRSIPHPVLEQFFLEHVARRQPFAGVPEKVQHLDNPETQAQFLRLFQDDRLLKKLNRKENDRALVFQFADGKLAAKRRSLIPREYHFY